MQFNEDELYTIRNGLAVAADRYAEDAKVIEGDRVLHEVNKKRLADQFRKQEAEARAIVTRMIEEGYP